MHLRIIPLMFDQHQIRTLFALKEHLHRSFIVIPQQTDLPQIPFRFLCAGPIVCDVTGKGAHHHIIQAVLQAHCVKAFQRFQTRRIDQRIQLIFWQHHKPAGIRRHHHLLLSERDAADRENT